MKKISIIIPVYCEEDVIEICYKEITKTMEKITTYDYELIFIDDGSKDKTLEILKEKAIQNFKVKIIKLSRNFGQQAASVAGMRNMTGDAVVLIDADLQDPPELIIEMIKLWEQGNDIVYAKRKKRKGETVFKKLTAKMFYKAINKLADIEIPQNVGYFRLVDKKIVNIINDLPENDKFLKGIFSWVGFKQVPLEYEREKRYYGKTKYSVNKLFRLAMDGIISFSSKPLKIIGGLGLFSIFISILVFIYGIVSYIVKLDTIEAGWTSLICVITFFSGIQLTSLWIISEYIARIFNDTKHRPEYIIEEKINIERD